MRFVGMLGSSRAVLEGKITIVTSDRAPSEYRRGRRIARATSVEPRRAEGDGEVLRPIRTDATQPPASPVSPVGCRDTRRSRSGLPRSLAILSAAPLAFAITLATGTASAADVGKTEASAKGKGITGGALLGAELVCGVEAIAGVKSPWAYLGGGVAGAAAGGVGGYFVEQHGSPRASMLMLAGGLTLIIPTIVGVLSATAYSPPVDYLTDKPPADEPVANPPQPDLPPHPAAAPAPPPAESPASPATTTPPPAGSPAAPASPSTPATGPSSQVPRVRHLATRSRSLPPLVLTPPALVAFRPGALALSVPAVELQDTYTRAELAMYGVKQTTEVHIPVVDVVF